MRIVLDTNVFFHPPALDQIGGIPHDAVVPAVAYAERVRQLARRGVTVEEFDAYLRGNDLVVEPLGPEEASRHPPRIHDDAVWARVARDALIAGHVRDGDVLWTANVRDFLDVGVPEAQVVDIAQMPPG